MPILKVEYSYNLTFNISLTGLLDSLGIIL